MTIKITIEGKIGEGKSSILQHMVKSFCDAGFYVEYKDVGWKTYATRTKTKTNYWLLQSSTIIIDVIEI